MAVKTEVLEGVEDSVEVKAMKGDEISVNVLVVN